MEVLMIGATIAAGLAVIIFLRRGKFGIDDYSYTVPKIGQRGCGQKSIDQVMQDAERGICNRTDID